MGSVTERVRESLASVAVIPVTPFGRDGAIDVERYEALVADLCEDGFEVITPNGNTGEFHALSGSEHRETIAAASRAAAGRGTIVAGVGFDVATAIELGRFAEASGARAVMIHQPAHPQRSDRGWVRYHQAIALALPDMAVVPYVRDPRVTPAMIRSVAESCPNLAGIKYAVADALGFAALAQELSDLRLTWVCGLAEPWAPFFWVSGATGFTSGLANVHPQLSHRMLDCLRADDLAGAMAAWRLAQPFEELRARRASANNVPVVKEALHQQGRCERTVRPPLEELDEAERSEVARILASWQPTMTPGGAW